MTSLRTSAWEARDCMAFHHKRAKFLSAKSTNVMLRYTRVISVFNKFTLPTIQLSYATDITITLLSGQYLHHNTYST